MTAETGSLKKFTLNPSLIGSLVCVAVVIACVVTGYLLRFAPMRLNDGFDFQNDGSFNYRMCIETIKNGHPPVVDTLSIYPIGKRIYEELPVGMYYGAAAVHRVLKGIGIDDVKMNVARFNAMSGALIAIPVFFIALSLGSSRVAACFAAFLAATIPLGLWRTHMSYFRQEVVGITVGMAYLACWVRALNAKTEAESKLNAVGAAVFLWAALFTWRMNLIVYVICAGAFMFGIAGESHRGRACRAYLITVLGYVVSCFTVKYLADQNTLFSSESALIFVTGFIALYLPRSRFEGRHFEKFQLWIYRLVTLATVFALAALFLAFSGDEAGMGVASVFKLALSRLGYVSASDGDTLLYSSSMELAPLTLERLMGSKHLSFALLMPLLSPFWRVSHQDPERQSKLALQTVLFYTAVSGVLMLLVASRNLTLFAPTICVLLVLGLAETLKLLKTEAFGPHKAGLARLLVATVIMGAVALSAASAKKGLELMLNLNPKSFIITPDEKRVYDFIRTNTSPKAVFWTQWSDGYLVQTYGKRATITDGLFEVPEIRRRVVEESKVMMARDEQSLVDFCLKYDVNYVLFDRKYAGSYAKYAGNRIIVRQDAPPVIGKKESLLFTKPDQLKHFELVISSPALLLYRFHRDPAVKGINKLLPEWFTHPKVK
jgi:asparagine N-glycosylation enzyme membrane subunit Stt3